MIIQIQLQSEWTPALVISIIINVLVIISYLRVAFVQKNSIKETVRLLTQTDSLNKTLINMISNIDPELMTKWRLYYKENYEQLRAAEIRATELKLKRTIESIKQEEPLVDLHIELYCFAIYILKQFDIEQREKLIDGIFTKNASTFRQMIKEYMPKESVIKKEEKKWWQFK
ncbi:MAG: hypothetical protein IT212_07825 [Bacteroidia bacterium]|nr:hypothetical protein [Bacteroidia bacterium]